MNDPIEHLTPHVWWHRMSEAQTKEAAQWLLTRGLTTDDVLGMRWFGGAIEIDVIDRGPDGKPQIEYGPGGGRVMRTTDRVPMGLEGLPHWWPREPQGVGRL